MRVENRAETIGSDLRDALRDYFDSEYYVSSYPAVVQHEVDPLEYFLTTGWREGHNPNQWFDTSFYLAKYQDVKTNPLLHYISSGEEEGRAPNPDSMQAVVDEELCNLIADYFDADYYAEQYPEVVNRRIDPLGHYLRSGWRRGFNPNSWFNTSFYLDRYPDVAEADTNPLLHYIYSGEEEGRITSSKQIPNGITAADWHGTINWIDKEDADVEAYVSGLAEQPDYDLASKLQEWKTSGVVIFRNVADPDLIDKIVKDLDHTLDNNHRYDIRVDGNTIKPEPLLHQVTRTEIEERNLKLVDFHEYSYNAALLAMQPTVVSFLRHIFQETPSLLQSLTFKRGSEQDLHQDFPYVYRQMEIAKMAACWFPLEDIVEASGPLEYYLGSHKTREFGFFDWGHGFINQYDRYHSQDKSLEYTRFLNDRIRDLGLKRRKFLASKGDVLLWHAALVHGGTRIQARERTRKSFVCHYTPVTSHYKLARNRINRGIVFDHPGKKDIRDRQR